MAIEAYENMPQILSHQAKESQNHKGHCFNYLIAKVCRNWNPHALRCCLQERSRTDQSRDLKDLGGWVKTGGDNQYAWGFSRGVSLFYIVFLRYTHLFERQSYREEEIEEENLASPGSLSSWLTAVGDASGQRQKPRPHLGFP